MDTWQPPEQPRGVLSPLFSERKIQDSERLELTGKTVSGAMSLAPPRLTFGSCSPKGSAPESLSGLRVTSPAFIHQVSRKGLRSYLAPRIVPSTDYATAARLAGQRAWVPAK